MCFIGEWENDKRHGHGIYWYANGDVYDGQWVNSHMSGHGESFCYNVGNFYSGGYLNSMRHGHGNNHFNHHIVCFIALLCVSDR